MAVKLKTWIWVIVAIAVVGIVGLIAMAAAGMYFFARHVQSTEASPAVASRSFDEVRAKFANQKPLIEMDERGDFLRSNLDRERPSNPAPIEAMHVMIFDPDDGRLVRFSIPWWLIRLQSGHGRISFDSGDMKLRELRITPEDLERFGPTLIVNHQSAQGERVLVWSQ